MNKNKMLLCAAAMLALASVFTACGGKACTVSFSDNAGDNAQITDLEAKTGKKLAEPEIPVREGYQFTGWYKDEMLGDKWNFAEEKLQDDLILYAGWDLDTGDEIVTDVNDKDFSAAKTPGSQESAYEYKNWFLPAVDGIKQPYVGDPMPYCEDGHFYIYYLKEGGDSYNHSIYLAKTDDFVTYEEKDDPVIEANRNGGQDGWTGTGSMVKVDDEYLFFYTAHAASSNSPYGETIMLAKGSSPDQLTKVEGWELLPPPEIGQKRDFRDPQAYYDAESGTIMMTVTASSQGVARILKYTLSKDLTQKHYDGIIFTDKEGIVYNLECSDLFKIGDVWYLTFSAQDDDLYYATADNPDGPYSEAVQMDGKLFYAAKHVEHDGNLYMVGWGRRSESPSSTSEVSAWGGNLIVQKLVQKEDKSLILAPCDEINNQYKVRRALSFEEPNVCVAAGAVYSYTEAFTAYESFKLSGHFTFNGTGCFGLAFDFGSGEKDYKMITLDPKSGEVRLEFNDGADVIAQVPVVLEAGKDYSFTYIQEGSLGTFYVDDQAALTCRVYGITGKPVRLFAESNMVSFTSLREYTR